MAPPEEEDDVVTPRPLTPTLYVAGPTGIAVINLANDSVEEVRNELTGPFVITPDGTFAFAHQRFPTGPLTKVDLQTYETTEVTGSVFLGEMAITPDGSRIYAILDEASVIRIDVAANRALLDNPITVGDSAVSIAIAPDGSRAYVTNAVSEDISVIDLATDEVVATISDLSIPVYVAVNPTGDRLYVANSVTNGRVEVIDLNTLTVIATVPVGGSAGASAIAVTPDGTRAYIGTRGNSPPSPPRDLHHRYSNERSTWIHVAPGAQYPWFCQRDRDDPRR